MTVYTSKDALVGKIKQVDVIDQTDFSYIVTDNKYYKMSYFINKKYCFETREEAVLHAKTLIDKKIKSMEKRLLKLKKIQF
jgi:hypothetical protein